MVQKGRVGREGWEDRVWLWAVGQKGWMGQKGRWAGFRAGRAGFGAGWAWGQDFNSAEGGPGAAAGPTEGIEVRARGPLPFAFRVPVPRVTGTYSFPPGISLQLAIMSLYCMQHN